MHDEPHDDVAERAGDRGGQEADRGLDGGDFLHVLEEEGEHALDSIKGAPREEDGEADAREDAVAPEGVGDDGGAGEALLAGDPGDEGGDQGEGDEEGGESGSVADIVGGVGDGAACVLDGG